MILITVGTTPFDNLIKHIDENAPQELDLLFQIADGDYEPTRFSWFSFTDDINNLYREAELVICHAGAGTVYTLLEMVQRIIVIPNLSRKDVHQTELAKFVEDNNYGAVCWSINDVFHTLSQISGRKFLTYEKDPFFFDGILSSMIKNV